MATTTDVERAKRSILDMLVCRNARTWRKEAGRPEIKTDHVPIGWLPLDDAMRVALHTLVRENAVTIVDLPHRHRAGTVVSFIARVGK